MRKVLSLLLFISLPSTAAIAQQDLSTREAELLRDPRIQELRADIQSAKEAADVSLNLVRDWLASEVNFLFTQGSANPTIELGGGPRDCAADGRHRPGGVPASSRGRPRASDGQLREPDEPHRSR